MMDNEYERSKKANDDDSQPPADAPRVPHDLEGCPRCGQRIEHIIWGQTNCPRCGLHFECC